MNVLPTANKMNFLTDVLNDKSENMIFQNSAISDQSFIDLLFDAKMNFNANNNKAGSDLITQFPETKFNNINSDNLPEPQEADKFSLQDLDETENTLADFGINDHINDQQGVHDIKNGENAPLNHTETKHENKPVVMESIRADDKNQTNSDINKGKELSTGANNDKNRVQDSNPGSVAKLSKEDIAEKKNEPFNKSQNALSGIEPFNKSQNALSGIEKDEKSLKSKFIKKINNLLANKELKQKNPELSAKLEKAISLMEGKDIKDIKPEVIKELRDLLSQEGLDSIHDLLDTKNKGLMAKLDKMLSLMEGKDAKGIKPEVIKELQDFISREIPAPKIKELRESISPEESDSKSKELITKLKNVLSIANGKTTETKKPDISEKPKDSIPQKKIDNEKLGLSAMLEKLKSKHGENTDKKVVNREPDTNFLKKGIDIEKQVKPLGEKIDTKVIDTNEVKVVQARPSAEKIPDKIHDSRDNRYSSGRSETSENELNGDSKLTSGLNKTDTLNFDKAVKEGQKFGHFNNVKNEPANQQQNKDKFTQHNKNNKEDNGKSQQTDTNTRIAGDNTQTTSNSKGAEKASKSTEPRNIPQSELGKMVVNGAKSFLKGGNSEIHLNIKSPDLGNIKISFIENGKGKLDVIMIAERPEAAEMIKQNSHEIKQLLLQDGIDLSKLNVFDANDGNQRFFAQENPSFKNFRRKHSSVKDEFDDITEMDEQDEDLNVNEVMSGNDNDKINNDKINVLA